MEVFLISEYNTPSKLDIAMLGWEDGINISRNGLHIYATCIPADSLSFTLSGDGLDKIQDYGMGPRGHPQCPAGRLFSTGPWTDYGDTAKIAKRSTMGNLKSPFAAQFPMARPPYTKGRECAFA